VVHLTLDEANEPRIAGIIGFRAGQKFGRILYGRQRIAKFMRQQRQELILTPTGSLKLLFRSLLLGDVLYGQKNRGSAVKGDAARIEQNDALTCCGKITLKFNRERNRCRRSKLR
jgi:hypothetical protein